MVFSLAPHPPAPAPSATLCGPSGERAKSMAAFLPSSWSPSRVFIGLVVAAEKREQLAPGRGSNMALAFSFSILCLAARFELHTGLMRLNHIKVALTALTSPAGSCHWVRWKPPVKRCLFPFSFLPLPPSSNPQLTPDIHRDIFKKRQPSYWKLTPFSFTESEEVLCGTSHGVGSLGRSHFTCQRGRTYQTQCEGKLPCLWPRRVREVRDREVEAQMSVCSLQHPGVGAGGGDVILIQPALPAPSLGLES